ncbi:unnamed protein product [Lymnaea stagnalis]|uniref:Uncharacterized protein n=1 Tax=Lymnaea stagnalis TaxID=6523 RepID=A0AAV2H2G7_LYMST
MQLLDKLQSLNVSGNLLGSIDVLRVICNLGQLTNLILHDQNLGLSNPMCNTSYIDEVLIMLPAIFMLDGQRVRGKGSELFKLCKEMDRVLNCLPVARTGNLNDKKCTDEEVVVTQWIVDTEPKQDKVLDSEEQLSAMLASCKVLSQKGEEMLADAKDSHERR